MSITAQDLAARAETRLSEGYMVEQRDRRKDSHSDRMARLDKLDRLYRGDWSWLTPGETSLTDLPKVMNQVQVELDDIARLVSETQPSIRVQPKGDSDTATKQAAVREAICAGYWTYNRAERLVPQTAMDLAGAGCAFWLPYVRPGFDYPALMRLDPRGCYPTIVNGELVDLMRISVMKARVLRALTGIDLGADDDDTEIIGFYDPQEWGEVAYAPRSRRAVWVTEPRRHGITDGGRPICPVAFAQLDSFDGAIRGMFDQMGGTLEAKNRIAGLILDNADQMVYAPIVQYDVENAGDFGPLAIINKNSKEAEYERAMPSQVSPQLFALMQMLEGESRAGGGYPATRQGEVGQSIASATFVSSTMGQLTSTVRNIQRLEASMREQANRIMFALDTLHLDKEKPLCRAVANRKTYLPSKDIADSYDNEVIYGAGAGLDKANQYVLALQLKGAGLISNETIMGELSEVPDPVGELERIEREQMRMVVLQKLASEASLPMALEALIRMNRGEDLPEVAQGIMEQAQKEAAAQQAAQGPQQPGAQMPEQMTPEQVQAQQTSMEKGGIPGQAPAQQTNVVPFTPPTENIFVR